MWSLEAFRRHDERKIKHVEWFGSWLTNTQLSDRPPGNTSPLQSGRMLTLCHKPALSCCSQRLSGVRHRLKHDKIRWSSRMQTFFCTNQSDVFCVARSPVDYWDNIMGDYWEGNYTAKAECLSFWQTWRKQTEEANITRRMSCEALCSLWAGIVWRIKCIAYKSSRNGVTKTEVVYVYFSLFLWLKKFQSATSLTRGGRLRLFVLLSDNLMC